MSAYEELVEKVVGLIDECDFTGPRSHTFARQAAADVLAEVLRTLETVTPEMGAAGKGERMVNQAWRAMLCASPLTPP